MAWMRTREHFLALSPERLWPVLSDLSRLPEWNTAVAAMRPESPDGSVTRGTPVHQIPRGPLVGAVHTRTAGPAIVTEFDPPAPATEENDDAPAAGASVASLAWRQTQPGGGLLVRWELVPHTESTTDADGRRLDQAGTLLRQRVSVDGLLSGVFAELAAKPLASAFAENCARLYALAQGAAPDLAAVPSPAPDTPAETAADPASGLKVVIAGGTGFLGRQLAADLLCRGHDVVLLTRNPDPELPFRQAVWDGRTVAEWSGELAGGPGQRVAVVNLAGKLVDVRPTRDNIAALRASRVDSTHALVEASRELPAPVDTWIQASTTAIYGDAGEKQLTEDSGLPTGPAALPQMTGVAGPWEAAVADANADRLHVLRTSIVLEQECPAYDRLALLARAGLGGTVGDGQQWFSWIHLHDWLAIVRGALGLTPGLTVPAGVVNAAAPEPVRNRNLMRTLRSALAPQPLKRYSLNTPAPLLNVGAVALRTDPALGLTGRHVTSRILADAGFTFRHPDLPGAVRDIVG